MKPALVSTSPRRRTWSNMGERGTPRANEPPWLSLGGEILSYSENKIRTLTVWKELLSWESTYGSGRGGVCEAMDAVEDHDFPRPNDSASPRKLDLRRAGRDPDPGPSPGRVHVGPSAFQASSPSHGRRREIRAQGGLRAMRARPSITPPPRFGRIRPSQRRRIASRGRSRSRLRPRAGLRPGAGRSSWLGVRTSRASPTRSWFDLLRISSGAAPRRTRPAAGHGSRARFRRERLQGARWRRPCGGCGARRSAVGRDQRGRRSRQRSITESRASAVDALRAETRALRTKFRTNSFVISSRSPLESKTLTK